MKTTRAIKPTSKEALYGLERMLDNTTKIIEKSMISDRNKQLILEHRDHVLGNSRSIHRAIFYMKRLKLICEIATQDLDKFTIKDVEKVMGYMNRSTYSKWYVEDIKSTFKVFYRYHYKLGKNDPAPELVRWIERKRPRNDLKREELLTPTDVDMMISACENNRDRAMLTIAYAGACRPGELPYGKKFCSISYMFFQIVLINGLISQFMQ